MRLRSSIAVLLAVVSLSFACDEAPPTAPNITNINQNTVILNPGSPDASPSPGGQCVREAVDSVRVNPFGYEGCPGQRPSNSSGLLPAGCTARVTATPKGPTGQDTPSSLHGTQIVWSVTSGAALIEVTDNPEQPFNKNVRARQGVTSGEFQLTATVCGVTGGWNGRVVP